MSNAKSVVVIDDDLGMLKGLRRILRGHGFDAKVFESSQALDGNRALDLAFCVVIDINLNRESGIDVCNRLRSDGLAAPVIFITGNDSPANRAAAERCGCHGYLTKPFSGRSLIDLINQVPNAA